MDVALHELLSKVFGVKCQLVSASDRCYEVSFTIKQTYEFVEDCARILNTLSINADVKYSKHNHPCLVIDKILFQEKRISNKLSILYNLLDLPLHLAAMKGSVRVFKKHLQAGADVNKRDGFSETPLHIAARAGQRDIVQLLLESGADVNSQTCNKETAIRIAISLQDPIILQKILAVPGAEVDSKDDEVNTYLHLAAQVGNEVILNQLIEAGISIESRNQRGETPLMAAVYANNPSTTLFLLEKGANIDHQEQEGATALHIAASQDNYSMLKILFVYGADVTIKNNQNETILQLAMRVLNEKIGIAKNNDALNSIDKESIKVLKMVKFFTKAANLRNVSIDPKKEENKFSSKFGMS